MFGKYIMEKLRPYYKMTYATSGAYWMPIAKDGQIAKLIATTIGLVIITISVAVALLVLRSLHTMPAEHSQRTVVLSLVIPPGGSQAVNAYLDAGDGLNLSWATNGPEVAFNHQLETGHRRFTVLASGLSNKGKDRFSADHGALYGVLFRNFSRNRVTLTVKGTGTFEYFRSVTATAGVASNELMR